MGLGNSENTPGPNSLLTSPCLSEGPKSSPSFCLNSPTRFQLSCEQLGSSLCPHLGKSSGGETCLPSPSSQVSAMKITRLHRDQLLHWVTSGLTPGELGAELRVIFSSFHHLVAYCFLYHFNNLRISFNYAIFFYGLLYYFYFPFLFSISSP